MATEMGTVSANTSPSSFSMLKRWIPLAILLSAMVFAFANGWHRELTLSNLIMNREALGASVAENYWFTVLTYCGLYVLAVSLSIPGASWITVAGGLVFGWVYGGIFTAFAATAGATIIYVIARTSFGSILSEKAGPRLKKLASGLQENAFSYLLFLRLVPLFPFWLINLAPALFNVKVSTYVAATFIGILPGTFAYALLGEGLDSLVAAQEAANPGCAAKGTCEIDVGAAITPEIIAALVGLAIVSLVPIIVQKMRTKSE